MNDIITEIQSKIKSKIFINYSMSKSTWFRTGGKASGYTIINNIKDLKIITSYRDRIKLYVVGVGSNLLVRDNGFDGIIIRLGKSFNKIKIRNNNLIVGTSVLDLNLAKFALKNSIKDFEFFRGIPGSVGGAIKMNAGCYGHQTADNLKKILVLDKNGEFKKIKIDDLHLGYRSSRINDECIILQAYFNFQFGAKEEILNKFNDIQIKRESSQPIKEKTSGSTFKNPINKFAAELIEKSGCKNLRVGGAVVSEIHSNFIINKYNATSEDIENLGKQIIKKVKKNFGISLEWEIKIIGNENK
tara:strand:- start:498 stop:1400 length:903 start_codon:yes stop_codon:yes gene_type:complete